MRVRQRMWLPLMVALAAFATACGDSQPSSDGTETSGVTETAAGEQTETAGPSTLVIGTDAEPTTLDVQLIDDNGKDLSVWSINEGLVDLNPEGELEPILAAELPEMDPDDPTRWRVELREGIEFTDGTPFDAEAVVYNVERILDEDYGSVFAAELGKLSAAEAIDEYTVELITDGPDPILDSRLRVLRMVSPTAAEDPDYAENPVGTGPYVYDSWNRGQSLTLVANEDYWGEPKPTIDTVEIRFLPDNNTRISALEAGELDIAINIPASRSEGLNVITGATGTEAGGLAFATSKFPYSELAFRQALDYAIDREAINQQLFNGLGEPTRCQPVVPGAAGFNDELEPREHDPERAQQLLSEVDLPDDFVLDFNATTAVYQNDREISEAIAGYWQALGLEVDTTFHNIDSYLDSVIYDVQDRGVSIFWTDQALNHGARQVGTFVQQGSPVPTRGPDQFTEVDPLVETALSSLDEAEREEAFDRIWEVYCDQSVIVYTIDFKDVTGISERVQYEPDVGKFEKMDYHRVRLTS